MHGPERRAPARQREIDALALARRAALRPPCRFQLLVEQRFQELLGLVGGGADLRPLGGRQAGQRAQELGQRALPAEKADADLLELGGGAGDADGLPRLGEKGG
jgi:hypothetical protein